MGPAVEMVFALLPRQRIRRGHKCVGLGHTAARIPCPSDVHNLQAETHRKQAADHAAAADALKGAEEDACKSIASESRSWCPLLGPVAEAENMPNGVRITVRY